MFHILDIIRSKSQRERQAIAVMGAGSITGVIFIFWLVSFLASLHTSAPTVQSGATTPNFSSLIQSFQDTSASIQEDVQSAHQQFETITTGLSSGATASPLTQPDTAPAAGSDEVATPAPTPPQSEITSTGIEIIQVDTASQ